MPKPQASTIAGGQRASALSTRFSAAAMPLRRLFRLLGFAHDHAGPVRLHTVVVMRWIAVVGQLFTILFVHFSLGISLPLPALLPAVALTAVINVMLARIFRASARLPERAAGLLFAYDVVQLCWLLALTGALQNPFAVLILLPVTLAASTLGFTSTVAITGLALLGTTCLALLPVGLPWKGGLIELPALYVLAAWTALSTSIVIIAIFAWNISEEARRHADALVATQSALAREQQLSALGAQAAAAAHLLGSPLGTINIIAKELVRELPADSPMMEEARDLLQQIQRSRDILATLSRPQMGSEHHPVTRAPLSSQLEAIAAEFQRAEVDVDVTVDQVDDTPEPELVLAPEFRNAFANLIDNAIQFAHREVLVTVSPSRTGLVLEIQDDGPGFSPEVLDWLGEPYLSTRHEKGGLGLGIFIANTLLARTGASLHFENSAKGARVQVSWPRTALERAIEEMTDGRKDR